MTLASIAAGLEFPTISRFALSNFTSATVDATGEKIAMIGRLYISGRPTSAKTLSTGTIQFSANTCTFANGGTTLDVGIQGVASGAGPIAQPNGTFTVKRTLTGGAGITSGAWNTITMNSGTTNLSHGDLIAVVWDMTARAGADSVIVNTQSPMFGSIGNGSQFPTSNAFFSSAWQTAFGFGAGRVPNVVIVFDDGSVGWLDNTVPANGLVNDTFQDSTNPDERGMIFQVPWDCKIDALWANVGTTDANSDFTLKLYSDPLGSPSAIASVAVAAENTGVAGVLRIVQQLLATEVSLSKNTDYAITVLATGTSGTQLAGITLGDTAHRVSIPGGTTLKKVTRNNSTGAFSAESPAVTMYQMGVRISQLDDGTGSGASGGHIASRQLTGM